MAKQSSLAFEFCVSAGEGTLIDYGVCDQAGAWMNGAGKPCTTIVGRQLESLATVNRRANQTLIVAPCDDQSEIGK